MYMDVLASYVESVGHGPCAFPDRMWAIQYIGPIQIIGCRSWEKSWRFRRQRQGHLDRTFGVFIKKLGRVQDNTIL